MKSLTITLVAVILCVSLTGLNKHKAIQNNDVENTEIRTSDFSYDFAINKHVRKNKIPSNT